MEPFAPTVGQGLVKATRKDASNARGIRQTRTKRPGSGVSPKSSASGQPMPLKRAEENYRTLIRLEHPDSTGEDSPEANARAAELNEAVEFFRELLGR